MKGMRSAMKSCSMGKTTAALTEPWMAQRMTTVVAKPRSGEMRPVVMMIVMSTRTRRSWLGLGLGLGLGVGLGLGLGRVRVRVRARVRVRVRVGVRVS